MNYSKELDKILKYELSNLIERARQHSGPFDREEIEKYYQKYKEIKEKEQKK